MAEKSVARAELAIEPIDANFSLKDKIYDSLKQAITSMNIYADDAELRLDERSLSEQLEISRTPVREALARLEQEGLVRIIPRSGRKSYMAGAHARRIIGMDADEGAKLIQELTDFATQDEFVYSHKWRVNDLVIWDNRCTLHRGTPFEDLKYKCDMRRTTIDEYAPSWAAVG